MVVVEKLVLVELVEKDVELVEKLVEVELVLVD